MLQCNHVFFVAVEGPQRVEGPCVTCGLNMQDALPLHRYLCPGHFGCIILAVPVFNPTFFKELIQVVALYVPYVAKFT